MKFYLATPTGAALIIAAAVMLAPAAHAQQFPATNSEKGCVIINLASATRIEQMNAVNAEACQRLKADLNGNLLGCVTATAMTYNRTHGRGDFDRVPAEISEAAHERLRQDDLRPQ